MRLRTPRRPNRPATNERGQNRTEAAFDAYLASLVARGVVCDYHWDALAFRIAGRTELRADFLVRSRVIGQPEVFDLDVIDVKGWRWRDDAAVKIKVVAERYAWLARVWLVRQTKAGGWQWERVDPVVGLTRPGPGPWDRDWIT